MMLTLRFSDAADLDGGETHIEARATAGRVADPHAPTVKFGNIADEVEAKSDAVAIGNQALERLEYPFAVRSGDARTVIDDGNLCRCLNAYGDRPGPCAMPNRILYEVGKSTLD